MGKVDGTLMITHRHSLRFWRLITMAFGEHSGNHWLALPGTGVALLGALYFDIIPAETIFADCAFVAGSFLLVVGTVLAGLLGHVVWLVPFALVICSPFILLSFVSARLERLRSKRQRSNTELSTDDSS